MEYGYCNTSITAMRSDPSERAEMVSQLFFCEVFAILEDTVKWLFIRNENDGYTGWIDRKHYTPLQEEAYTVFRGYGIAFPNDRILQLKHKDTEESLYVFHGNPLPINLQGDIEIDGKKWIPQGETFFRPATPKNSRIVEFAKQYIHVPYIWGGKSWAGCDCSGFVQSIYNMNGITIKRDAAQQARDGETINLIDEAVPGDLAFFDNHENNIIHVGIIIENKQIIHCSGYVRIDTLDHLGIYNSELQTYTHKLRIIKRYF
jgi:hypothetical protein